MVGMQSMRIVNQILFQKIIIKIDVVVVVVVVYK